MKIREYLLLYLLSAVIMGCGGKKETVEPFDTKVYMPVYALGFDIRGTENGKSTLITSVNPWQGADSVSTSLLILREGESAPAAFEGQVLENEAKRIVAMSSTHIAMLDAIGMIDRVVGVSGLDFISNKDLQARREEIGDVGFEGNLDYERLVSLNPDIVLLYGIAGASTMENKLKELDIPFMYVGDYLEEVPLGKTEWLVALAEITGQREKAKDIFTGIADRYTTLKTNIRDKMATSGIDSIRPLVMINAPYGDSWFMPPVKSYAARLIEDAAGQYIYDKNQSRESLPIDMEEAYRLVSVADIWINAGTAADMAEFRAQHPRFSDVACVRDHKVFNNNKLTNSGGGNDYFESGVTHPDLILRDLIAIFHPELTDSVGELTYYRQLK